MMVGNSGSTLRLLQWQWRNVVIMTMGAVLAFVLIKVVGLHWMELPVLPLQVVGAALGIFVSFRTNSAYGRWWEGRQLWGKLINVSRMWASQAIHYVGPADPELAKRLVHRHVAYVHALRVLLRLEDPFADADFVRTVPDDLDGLQGQSNLTHALLHKQLEEITALQAAGKLDPLRLQSMDGSLMTMLDVQGGCERIKKTPFPRGYAFIAERLIMAYALLLPYALVHDLGWVAIPANVLVCLSFGLISEAGRVLEDPFNMFYNGLPLTNMSLTIERNIRERLGETDLVEITKPDARGILM